MLNKKSNKGITLIALIITIVVMLILVAVTLMIALGENGVITTTKNTRKEHEAAAFKEYVEIVAAGHYDATYEWGVDVNVSGKYDWITIQEEIKQEYPETNFMYNLLSMPGAAVSIDMIEYGDFVIECNKEMLTFLEGKNWGNKFTTAQRTMTDNKYEEIKAQKYDELKQKNEELGRTTTVTQEQVDELKLGSSNYIGTVKFGLNANISIYGITSSMIAEYNGTAVPVGFINSNMYDYYVIMNKDEAERLFEFTYSTEEGIEIATVNKYKGNAKNVKVPGTLIDEDGNPINVTGIDDYAFVKMNMKVSLIKLFTGMDMDDTDYDEVLYNNTATLADFKAELGMSEIEFDCGDQDGDQCTKLTCKNEFLKLILNSTSAEDMAEGGIILGEAPISECIAVESDGVLYGYFEIGENAVPIRPSEFVESNIQTVLVSEGIQTIGDSFMNCTKLKEIYLPSTLDDIGDETFNLCNSLTTIKTMNEDIAESSSDYGAPNDITKIYIEMTAEAN